MSEDDREAFEDSEEEEEREALKKRKAKKKRAKFSFADDEAGEEDEDDDDELDDRERRELKNRNENKAMLALMKEQDARRLHMKRFDLDEDAQVQAARFEAKRLEAPRTSSTAIVGATVETARFAQNRPTNADPKLFIVKCKIGEENELVVNLYKKYVRDRTRTVEESTKQDAFSRFASKTPVGSELQIFSVLAPGTKGTIYVEAMRKECVEAALRGVEGVYLGRKIEIVRVEEMVDVLSVEIRKEVIRKNDLVRIKGATIYRGDLAQVFFVQDAGNKVWVRVLPRIDLNDLSIRNHATPARMFIADEVRNAGGEVHRDSFPLTGNVCDIFQSQFYDQGMLFLELNLRQLDLVNPERCTAEELEVFGDSIAHKKARKPVQIHEFSVGDNVQICSGQDMGLEGSIERLSMQSQTAQIKTSQLANLVHVRLRDLVKKFNIGDHVEVITGPHFGKTGDVVYVHLNDVERPSVSIVFNSEEEIQVFNSDLKLSNQSRTVVSVPVTQTLGGYALHDLVQLDQNLGAIVIQVGTSKLKVLTQANETKEIHPSAIRANRNLASKDAVASDSRNQSVSVNDPVSVISGLHSGKSGVVKRIHGQLLFVLPKSNPVVFVVRAKDSRVLSSGTKQVKAAGGKSDAQQQQQRRSNRDEWMHKDVRIIRGNDKGLCGKVVEGGSIALVKVELNARQRTIMVKREDLKLMEPQDTAAGANVDYLEDARMSQQVPSTPMNFYPGFPATTTTTTTSYHQPPVLATTAAGGGGGGAAARFKKGEKLKLVDTGEEVTVYDVTGDNEVIVTTSKGRPDVVPADKLVYA